MWQLAPVYSNLCLLCLLYLSSVEAINTIDEGIERNIKILVCIWFINFRRWVCFFEEVWGLTQLIFGLLYDISILSLVSLFFFNLLMWVFVNGFGFVLCLIWELTYERTCLIFICLTLISYREQLMLDGSFCIRASNPGCEYSSKGFLSIFIRQGP